MAKNLHARSIFALFALLTTLGVSPAYAFQRCDDIADELKSQIDNLKVGITAANTIYLTPAGKGALAGMFRA